MPLDDGLKIFQIIAALFVGGAAIWVSVLQYKTNNLKLKLELYDRRKNILKLTQVYMNDFLNSSEFDLYIPMNYRVETADAKYLFGADVSCKITEIFKKGLKLDVLNIDINMRNNGESIEGNPVKERLALRRKMSSDYDEIMDLFLPYLDLSEG